MDIVEIQSNGKLEDLFRNYRVVPPQNSRIWRPRLGYINGVSWYMPKEAWYNFYVNTSVINKINPQYVIWYANEGVAPNSWDDFAGDPVLAERYELPTTGMNESITATRGSPFFCYLPGPLRWSYFHWSLTFLEYGFYAILLVICLIFAIFKKQPLYSKGLTPSLALICQIMQIIPSAMFSLGDFETYVRTQMFLISTFYFTFLIMSYVVVPLHLFRFVLVLNINHMKGMYRVQIQTDRRTGQKKQIETVRWQFRALNLISRWWIYVIVLVVAFSLWMLLCLIVFGAYSFQTADALMYVMSTIYMIVTSIIIALIVLVSIFDFVTNAKKIFSCNKRVSDMKQGELFKKIIMYEYLVEEDPFMFRLEYVFGLVPLFLFFVIYSPLNAYVYVDFLTQAIGGSILQHMLLWYCTIFPLIVTTFWWIRSLIFRKAEKEELNVILDDEYGREIFTNFAKQEWSVENISLWDDIQDFLKESNTTQRQLKATNIYYNYLNGSDSKLEVNINKSLCQQLKQKIDTEPELDNNLFDSILQSVKVNLADTFSRLRLRNDYKSWKRTRDIQKEQLTGQKVNE